MIPTKIGDVKINNVIRYANLMFLLIVLFWSFIFSSFFLIFLIALIMKCKLVNSRRKLKPASIQHKISVISHKINLNFPGFVKELISLFNIANRTEERVPVSPNKLNFLAFLEVSRISSFSENVESLKFKMLSILINFWCSHVSFKISLGFMLPTSTINFSWLLLIVSIDFFSW